MVRVSLVWCRRAGWRYQLRSEDTLECWTADSRLAGTLSVSLVTELVSHHLAMAEVAAAVQRELRTPRAPDPLLPARQRALKARRGRRLRGLGTG